MWRRVIDVNLIGPYLTCRAVVPTMLEAGLRAHRQYRVGRRQGRQSERVALQRVEGRADRADEIARQGTREARTFASTRDAGRRARPKSSIDVAGAYRLHAVEDSDGRFLLPDESRRSFCWLASEDCCVQHRRGVRSVGRPRDVLTFHGVPIHGDANHQAGARIHRPRRRRRLSRSRRRALDRRSHCYACSDAWSCLAGQLVPVPYC